MAKQYKNITGKEFVKYIEIDTDGNIWANEKNRNRYWLIDASMASCNGCLKIADIKASETYNYKFAIKQTPGKLQIIKLY